MEPRKVYAVFLIYIFIFPLFASAQAIPRDSQGTALFSSHEPVPGETIPDPRTLIETPEETEARESGEREQPPPAPEEVPQVEGYVCAQSQLTPEESQGIIDLLKDGFTGNEIAGNTLPPGTEREELATNKLVLQNPANEGEAVQAEIPNKKFKPSEISQFLNTYIDGPFAFGVVLEDSLRTGRCETFGSEDCPLTGPNLRFRNSGVGIVEDIKPVKEAFSGFLEGEEDLTQFTEEENEVLRTALITDETVNSDGSADEAQIKTVRRLQKELIPNSILTEQFEARLQTNCQSSSCVISTYSLFDKYFNTWMSSEMVVSVFGPSLLYQTRKLFGWTARRGFFSGVRESYYEFLNRFRKEFVTPESFLGKLQARRIQTILDKHGWRDWYLSMTAGKSDGTGYNLFKTEEFQHFWGKQSGPGGFLDRIKTAEERADFIRLLKAQRSFLSAGKARNDTALESWELAKKTLGADHPVTKQKYIDWGRDTVSWMDEVYDEGLGADYIEWIARHPNAGFYNKGVLQVRPDGGSEVIDLFTEHRNLQRILKKFKDDGNFRGFAEQEAKYGSAYQNRGDDLVYYVFDRDTAHNYRNLSYSNLSAAASKRRDVWVQLDTGEFVQYNQSSVPFIQNRIQGNPQIFEGAWKDAGVLTPERITTMITNARTGPQANMKFGIINTQQMLDTVRERNWVSRRYWSALDKLMAQEDELIKSYFSIKGGAKWTVLPFGYWWAKKGFGVEGISQYQLPDTWHDLKFTHGAENIYDYAYIDFFANEGSDQGDLFLRMINNLPWKLILDEISDKYNPVRNLYNALTQNQLRDETENLAFYLTGPDVCVNCSIVINSVNQSEFRPFFFADNQTLTSYILEDTYSPEAREKGQTLIAYASHMNLEGESGNDEGEPINLIEAITNDEIKTCRQAVDELEFYGINFTKALPESLKEEGRIGAVLGGLESITYGTFFWAGIFSTAAIQIVIAPQLRGCVDVDEGYYAHYFVPVQETQDEQAGTEEKSTEKVSEVVQNFKETLFSSYEGGEETFTKEAVSELGEELDKFVKDSKSNDIVQATLTVSGLNSGQLESRDLFYFWCGARCEIKPSSYRTEGGEQIRGVNGSNVDIDFGKGEITADGNPIVQNADIVRMASTNLGIPAVEIPNSITETCIAPSEDVAIEINAQGEARVLNSDLLNCVRQGVLEQTGLPMESGTNKLNDVFGPLELAVTDTHPNIRMMRDRIVAEGIPRKVAEGADAKLFVLANKNVNLSSSNDNAVEAGRLQSLQFANGSLIVKPNGCFITWLRHHEEGVIPKDLVEGIKADLERVFNEETMCEEPAINFTLSSDPGSDAKTERVEKFNQSLEHLGPFSVFETPTQRYVISAEKDESGVCKDHLRIINKETGEVEDLSGVITQTPDGFRMTTDDGQIRDVKFSERDGAPFVQLDDERPELLTSAQGKNGSFYYDPETGLWYAENGQLLPLIEAFREGIAAQVGQNGEVTANAQGNVLNVFGQERDSGLLNLPSLPEEKVLLAIMLMLLIMVFVHVQRPFSFSWEEKEKARPKRKRT